MTRYLVGWEATGCAMGAYENALKYAQERLQFGKPIGSFQLVQDLLAKMLANITASQCLVVRMAQLEAEGKLTRRACGAFESVLHGQVPRDGRLGPRGVRRKRHRRRLQRGTFLRRRRSALLLRRHVSNAESNRWQSHHRLERVRVSVGRKR